MSKCKPPPKEAVKEIINDAANKVFKNGGITDGPMKNIQLAAGIPTRHKDILPGSDDKRGFKNIEGFIEGNQNMSNIDYLYSLHIIDNNDELRNKMYRVVVTDTSYIDSTGYNRNLCKKFSDITISDICNNVMKDYKKHYDIFKSNLDNYTSLYNYQMYLGGIINENFNFLDKIKNKINTYKQNNFIDNRKNSYLSSNLEFYKNIHFYIFILYYTIFIAFLIFSNFIKDKLYENIYVMIYVLAILIIPFILRYILSKIYNLYIYYIERNYLKLDEISYKYLVEETYHQKKNEKDKEQLNNFHAIRNL